MKSTSRLLFFLAFSGWIYTGCEPHDLSETRVLHEEHGHHDDDHGHDHDGDKHDDHGHGKADDHKKDHPEKEHKGGEKQKVTPKEEPRKLGI